MLYFLIEGHILNADKMNDDIMEKHKAYTQKAMDEGRILISGLKSDMSGGLFIIRAETLDILESYLENEPFKVSGIQDYKVTEFDYHYLDADWQ